MRADIADHQDFSARLVFLALLAASIIILGAALAFQLLGGFDGLVPELDDVHAARECGIHELFEVTLAAARIRAEIQARIVDSGTAFRIDKGVCTGRTGSGGRGVGHIHGSQPSSSTLGSYCGSRGSCHKAPG